MARVLAMRPIESGVRPMCHSGESLVRDWGPKPFRTIGVWLLEPGFKEMVGDKWRSYCVEGNSTTRFKDKLKILKADLKVWNRDVFGYMDTSKKRIVEEIDNQDDSNSLGEDDKLKRMELLSQLRVVDNKTESLCRQKAREKWLKFGDTNSRYYHSMLRWRRLRNEVKGVEVDSLWSEEPDFVHREAKKLFEDRFQATHDYGVRIRNVEF